MKIQVQFLELELELELENYNWKLYFTIPLLQNSTYVTTCRLICIIHVVENIKKKEMLHKVWSVMYDSEIEWNT